MNLIKSFLRSLKFMTLGSIVIILIVFAIAVELTGYYAFTASFNREYTESVSRIAEYSETRVIINTETDYLQYTQAELEEAYENYMSGEESSSETTDFEMDAYCYEVTKNELSNLCDTTGMSVIYIIIPDDDFQNYTSLINCPSKDSPYDPWEMGHREKTPDDYIEAYRNICKNGSNSELVNRYKNLGSGKRILRLWFL